MASGKRKQQSSKKPKEPRKKQKEARKKPENETELDYYSFRAFAGEVVGVAKKHSDVYFFPQGFLEQASTPASLSSSMVSSRPYILCRVIDVTYWADPVTDEVFVKYKLMPLKDTDRIINGDGNVGNVDGEKVVDSFVKCLSSSDANNGGGFSVPKQCAVSIFPALNLEDDPPVQTLEIRDVHGEKWEFRHIYRGSPRRHLLTSGWNDFVNDKVLTGHDCVIFAKNKVTGELSVGVRRHFTPLSRVPESAWGYVVKPPAPKQGEFSRRQRGRVPAERVVEETEKAMKDMTFEVVYYPRAGLPEFVVEAHKVEQASRVNWSSGMRVRFPQNPTEGGPRPTWFNGTVTSVAPGPIDGPWPGSVWRMLQITWDEPEKLEEIRMLSPWQVECNALTPPPPPPTIHVADNSPAERLASFQDSALLADGNGDISFTQLGLGSLVMGQLSPSCIDYNSFPAGIQGARQFPSIYPPTILNDASHQGRTDDNLDSNMSRKVEGVSTDLNIASSSSETLDSHNCVQFFGVMSNGHHSCNLTWKGVTSIQLFGKIIYIEQPLANTNGISYTECDNAESQRPL